MSAGFNRAIGMRIQIARTLAGRTQGDLARTLGISYQQLQKYERGLNRISAALLQELAAALRLEVGWFFQDGEPALAGAAQRSVREQRIAAELLADYFALQDQSERDLVHGLLQRLSSRQPRVAPARVADNAQDNRFAALLVDDNSDTLAVTTAFLRGSGYAVIGAPSGEQALRVLESQQTVDILVTDFAMPGLDGADLIEQAGELRPGLPALVITGFGADARLRELRGRVDILAKPFTRKELVARIESLLRVAAPT